jgi:hypothetical protein
MLLKLEDGTRKIARILMVAQDLALTGLRFDRRSIGGTGGYDMDRTVQEAGGLPR